MNMFSLTSRSEILHAAPQRLLRCRTDAATSGSLCSYSASALLAHAVLLRYVPAGVFNGRGGAV